MDGYKDRNHIETHFNVLFDSIRYFLFILNCIPFYTILSKHKSIFIALHMVNFHFTCKVISLFCNLFMQFFGMQKFIAVWELKFYPKKQLKGQGRNWTKVKETALLSLLAGKCLWRFKNWNQFSDQCCYVSSGTGGVTPVASLGTAGIEWRQTS